MDSVLEYSDDDFRRSKESDLFESDSSSKEVFKNIRTRYLSRVHSVTDPPLINSIVDQAFFKLNSPTINDNDVKEFKFELENVTTDETADDSLSPNCDYKVLAKVVLPLTDNKVLTRQNATDLAKDKISRQDAFDNERHDSPELTDYTVDLDPKTTTKSETTYIIKPREKTIFSRDFSGIYKGKPKAFSMENLNSNSEFKDALKEATSIDLFNVDNDSSLDSLFTEGSDSVFLSPVEKNNNDVNAISKYNSVSSIINKIDNKTRIETKPKKFYNFVARSVKNSNSDQISIVKAESLLPLPYSNDKNSLKLNLNEKTQVNSIDFSKTNRAPDDDVEHNLKRVHEELKLTFKAAIERIVGSNKQDKNNDVPKTQQESEPIRSINVFSFKSETSYDKTDSAHENIKDSVSDTVISDHVSQNIESKIENDFKIERQEPIQINIELPPSRTNNTKTDSAQVNNLLIEPVSKDNSDATSENASVDVSYHLKINNRDLEDVQPEIVPIPSTDVVVPMPRKKHKAFLAPINVIGANIDPATSIIISPVLIQPVLLKPVTSSSQGPLFEIKPIESIPNEPIEPPEVVEMKKSTVYYDDTDQVAPDTNRGNKPFQSKSDDSAKKKGIYQKNTKSKPLPLLPQKSTPNENISEAKSSFLVKATSPKQVDSTKPSVSKLSKTPEWLVDNQYYQPMDNIPFVINTVQTFTKPKIVDNKIKEGMQFGNTNTFLPPIIITPIIRHSEHENVYEEIGEPTLPSIRNNNIADDEKLSNIQHRQHQSCIRDEFESVTREALLNVPRKPKKPKKETKPIKEDITKQTAKITKNIISLSRTPSGKDMTTKTSNIGAMIQSLEQPEIVVPRKLSLQTPKSSTALNTSSLPREKPYWKTLEHKRLSHPIRSLNTSSRPLRKWMAFVVRRLNVKCENVNNSYQCMEHFFVCVCTHSVMVYGVGLKFVDGFGVQGGSTVMR